MVWNECAVSVLWSIVFSLSLLLVVFFSIKYERITSSYKVIAFIAVFLCFIIASRNFSIMPDKSIDEIGKTDILEYNRSKQYEISEGVRMGDGYKDDYCALQACTIYNGELYQFFNKGYYEIRDLNTMALKRDGFLNLHVGIHFGSVAFADRIEKGCSMPYLYATDDVGNSGNVYVIDFEKQKIVLNYSIVGGNIAAFDFSKETGYLIDGSGKLLKVKKFDIRSGDELDLIEIKASENLKTLQTVIFNNDNLFVLSGEINKLLMITQIDLGNNTVSNINSFPFWGEPEGLFIRNGEMMVTAVVGSWEAERNSPNYIHSEYFVIKRKSYNENSNLEDVSHICGTILVCHYFILC